MPSEATKLTTLTLRQYTVTAPLVAARLEEDSTIHLRVANPADPSEIQLVAFPNVTPDTHSEDRELSERMLRAREAFIEAIGLPPFEGFMLLYGTARLTLTAGGGQEQSHDGLMGGRPYPRVLDFVALDSSAPRPHASVHGLLSEQPSAAAFLVARWPAQANVA